MKTEVWIGILLPFLGTSLGAATFFSLLEPALQSSRQMGKLSFIPATVGFGAGIGFVLMMVLDVALG